MILLGSTSLYYTPLEWLHLVPLNSTTLRHGSIWLDLTLLHSTMALIGYTWSYYTLYHGSTWLYFTLLHSTMSVLGSNSPYFALLYPTWLYYTLPWLYLAILEYYTLPCLYLALLDSTTLYQGSAWLYYTLPRESTMPTLGSAWL